MAPVADLDSKLRPPLEGLLEPGEELRGVCVATQSSLFKGRMVGIGVTDARLIVQGLDRRFEPDCPATSLTPERIAAASAEGGGGGWATVGAAIMDHAAVTLKLRTTDGEKLKLMMMRGEGKLGGGETQRHGVQAVGEWFSRHASQA